MAAAADSARLPYGTPYFGTGALIYSLQRDLSVDHEFSHGIGLRASYIAMKSDQLVWEPNENDLPYSTTTPATQQPLTMRPFPNWGTINNNATARKRSTSQARSKCHATSRAGLNSPRLTRWPATWLTTRVRSFDESPDPDGQIARDLVARGVCTLAQLQHFGGSDIWRDEIYTQAALDILEHHTPNLLLLHLSASDML